MAKRYANRLRVNGKHIRKAHVVWNKAHPNDPIKKGEVIHHVDENKKNDDPLNLEKRRDAKHRSLHSDAGIKALQKWRDDHPMLARRQSIKNAKRLNKFLDENPDVETKRKRKIIRKNKLRRK